MHEIAEQDEIFGVVARCTLDAARNDVRIGSSRDAQDDNPETEK
jgi:hypothetical protein